MGDWDEALGMTIPSDARTDVVRAGRVYALDAKQFAAAQEWLDRHTTTSNNDEDFFAERTGRAVSHGPRPPF